MQAIYERVDGEMKRGVKERALRPEMADLAAAFFIGMMRALIVRDLLLGKGQGMAAELDGLLDMFFDGAGIGARGGWRVSSAAAIAVPFPARAPVNKWLVTLSVTFGTLMGAIDTSIVAVATPHLTGALGATVEEMTWVTTGFVIATVVVMPLTAFLGRLLRAEAGLPVLAGAVRARVGAVRPGALAADDGGLPRAAGAGRRRAAADGAGDPAPDVPARGAGDGDGAVRAGRRRRTGGGPGAGRLASSTTTRGRGSSTSTCPIGLLGIFMVTRFVHEPEDIRRENRARAADQRKNLDWQGIVLMTVGLASLQYVLEEGSRNDWFASHDHRRRCRSSPCSCWRRS